MSEHVCPECLRHAHLLGHLAPRIAGLLQRPREQDARPLLTLPADELIAAVCGAGDGSGPRRFLRAFSTARASEAMRAAGIGGLCRHAPLYPSGLRDLLDPPSVLFHTGTAEALGELTAGDAVALVGARRPSPYGLEVATELGRSLGVAGVTVVSGLALGIDAAAHRGALEGDGRPLAVLGGGADVPYPRTNAGLYARCVERGAVVAELPPGQRPFRWSFPARNRIMAALARMTVVVEARERSGTLITADFAGDLGRSVGAVPGKITSERSRGNNHLIAQGAIAVTGATAILDELFGSGAGEGLLAEGHMRRLDPVQRRLLDGVEAELDLSALIEHAGVPIREARAGLARLEASGLVRRVRMGSYERIPEPG